jgi:hypothetical protein
MEENGRKENSWVLFLHMRIELNCEQSRVLVFLEIFLNSL